MAISVTLSIVVPLTYTSTLHPMLQSLMILHTQTILPPHAGVEHDVCVGVGLVPPHHPD